MTTNGPDREQEKMQVCRVNRRSDFSFLIRWTNPEEVSAGDSVTLPGDVDFFGIAYVKGYPGVAGCFGASTAAVRFSRRGGECRACRAEPDGIRVICDSHGMPCGDVACDLTLLVPDALFPDGTRSTALRLHTGIRLVDGQGDGLPEPEVQAMLPYIYRSAYRDAVAGGYEGSQGEWQEAMSQLPEAVMSMNADWAGGKRRIAGALTAQGQPAEPMESMEELAGKILRIPRRGPSEEYAATPGFYGSQMPDTLNALRAAERADYPYCCGYATRASRVTLAGADAYLCSDGHFTTGGGEHAFPDFNMTGVYVRYVIYYFKSPNYSCPVPTGNVLEYAVLSGEPVLPRLPESAGCRRFLCVAPRIQDTPMALPSAYNKMHYVSIVSRFNANGPLINYDPSYPDFIELGCERVDSASQVYDSPAVLSMPNLEEVRLSGIGRSLLAARATVAYLPKLRLMTAGGYGYLASGAAITVLKLPALERLSGGGGRIDNCVKLTRIDMPRLKSCGQFLENCTAIEELSLPELETASGQYFVSNCPALRHIELPKVTTLNGAQYFMRSVGCDCDICLPVVERMPSGGMVYGDATADHALRVHLGRQQFAPDLWFVSSTAGGYTPGLIREITVEPGFRSSLRRLGTGLTAESMRALIRNLADNSTLDDGSPAPALTLELGGENMARLTDEDIALAQAKNYTVS